MQEQFLLFDESEFDVCADINALVIGADEAGRGPLAGPVCASAVALPQGFPFELLNDSKKMTERKRLLAEPVIKEKALAWAVCWATPKEIDEINILQASLLAMKRAFERVRSQLAGLGLDADMLLVDGNKTPDVDFPCQAIVKGDSKVPAIMAASILAKNARDRFMVCAASKWPEYGFEKHKGYPCPLHKQMLYKYGPCPIHRKTFKY